MENFILEYLYLEESLPPTIQVKSQDDEEKDRGVITIDLFNNEEE